MPQGFYNTTEDAFKRSHPLSNSIKLLGNDEAPFLKAIPHIAPELSKYASLSEGMSWAYGEKATGMKAKNKHLEGGAPATVEHFIHKTLTNQFQISKVSYGLSRTAKRQNGLSNLPYQEEQAHRGLMEDINYGLVKNTAPVKRTSTTEGESQGLYGLFTTNNEIDSAGVDINRKLLEEVCVEAKKKGINFTHFIVNDKQAAKLNLLFEGTYRTNYGLSKFEGTDIVQVGNIRGLTRPITRLYEPLIDDTDIVFVDMNSIALVVFDEQMGEKLPITSDQEQYQHLMEWSFWYDNPFVAWRIKGLKAD